MHLNTDVPPRSSKVTRACRNAQCLSRCLLWLHPSFCYPGTTQAVCQHLGHPEAGAISR
jgi:hypothetical protein